MSDRLVMNWVKEHKWWVALIVVVLFGYSAGKDMALRDNKAAAAQTAGAR